MLVHNTTSAIFDQNNYKMELRIKTILKEKGMTMNELAIKLGINRVSLSVSIGKDANPQIFTLKKIADALGVELYELFEREGKEESVVSGYLELRDRGIIKIQSIEDLERIYLELKM